MWDKKEGIGGGGHIDVERSRDKGYAVAQEEAHGYVSHDKGPRGGEEGEEYVRGG